MKVDTITIYTICTDDTVPDNYTTLIYAEYFRLESRTLFYSKKPFKS